MQDLFRNWVLHCNTHTHTHTHNFLYSFVKQHCFDILANLKRASMNNEHGCAECRSLCKVISSLLNSIPEKWLLGHMVVTFLWTYILFSINGYTNLYFNQQCTRVPFPLHPCHHLPMPISLIVATLMNRGAGVVSHGGFSFYLPLNRFWAPFHTHSHFHVFFGGRAL
jgi:hypothetical protein